MTVGDMSNEPVLTAAGAVAIITALFGVLVAFSVDISDAQQKAILAFCGTVLPVVFALIARAKVTPNSKLEGGE